MCNTNNQIKIETTTSKLNLHGYSDEYMLVDHI